MARWYPEGVKHPSQVQVASATTIHAPAGHNKSPWMLCPAGARLPEQEPCTRGAAPGWVVTHLRRFGVAS